MMTLREYLNDGKKRIEAASLECADPLLHMKQIAEAALDLPTSGLISRWEDPLSPPERARIETVLTRRLRGEPFQYIVGYEWFWDCRFAVGPGALIPRRETECLVEAALEHIPTTARVAELGAGTGVLGITCLRERPEWTWVAWENNPASLPYIQINQDLLPPFADYKLCKTDFFEGVVNEVRFDWVVANPPYVRRSELPKLSKEVRHEPAQALDGGESGLDILEKMIALAPRFLTSGGGLLLEIGSDQGPAAFELMQAAKLRDAAILKDYAGLDRVAFARMP